MFPQYIFRQAEKTAIPVSCKCAMKTLLRQLKQTKFCGHFSSWQKNNNSAKFHNKINKNSKLLKSPTTTMPTFYGRSEKIEPFEDLMQTSLKIHNQLTEDDKINYFHSFMRRDALKTFKNISDPTRGKFGEILAVFRWKYVKPQSMATSKHKFQKHVFNLANQKLVVFLMNFQSWPKTPSD